MTTTTTLTAETAQDFVLRATVCDSVAGMATAIESMETEIDNASNHRDAWVLECVAEAMVAWQDVLRCKANGDLASEISFAGRMFELCRVAAEVNAG